MLNEKQKRMYQSKSLILLTLLMLFGLSCKRFYKSECNNPKPDIIVEEDSLRYSIYATERCLIQGVEYCSYKDSVETIQYYKNGIQDGIYLSIDTINETIVLKYYSGNELKKSFLYLRSNKY